MRTFVLSGGGNRGPLQVGALGVLIERGIIPELIVGSSAGALNGCYLAIDPTVEQVEHMAQLWRDAARRRLFTASPVRSLVKALRGKDHLVDNRRIRTYVRKALPRHVHTFGDLRVPLYVTICHLHTQTLYVCGDDPDTPLLEAVITSTAVPGFFPPTYHNGEAFVDGGVVSNLPLKVAVARGATEIWAIDLSFEVDPDLRLRGAMEIGGWAIKRPLYANVLHELEWAIQQPGVTVHHIAIGAFVNTPLGDFSKTEAMIEEGRRAARRYLAHPKPNRIHHPRTFTPHALPPGPPGSRPFVEPRRAHGVSSEAQPAADREISPIPRESIPTGAPHGDPVDR